MTATITSTIAGDRIPIDHLLTTILVEAGYLWLYGFHGHDGTARFSAVLDEGPSTALTVLCHNAPWPQVWTVMLDYYPHGHNADRVAQVLRTVLPPT